MALMSMFYLQQIPTRADLERLEKDIRREHGLYLSAIAPIEVTLVRPGEDGGRSGLDIKVVMRADLRKHPQTIDLYLKRIAESVVEHPDWQGKITKVSVAQFKKGGRSYTLGQDATAPKPPIEAAPGPDTAGSDKAHPAKTAKPVAPAKSNAHAPGGNEATKPAPAKSGS